MKRIVLTLLACVTAVECGAAKTAERPKIWDIAFVRVKVSSPEADSFYRGLLKLPRLPEGPCYFLNLFERVELAENAKDLNLLETVALYADVKAVHRYLASRGYKPGPFISDRHETTYFEIRDPENHDLFFSFLRDGYVKGRPAMDKFYKDVLGFHVYWQSGMKEGQTNWVDIEVQDGTDGIKYLLNVPAGADKRTLGVMNPIALGGPDVRAVAKQLENAGVKLTEPPKIGRDGKWQLNLYDPDHTRVELMEFTPVEKPRCAEYTGPHPKP